jgi:hypothetical protein
MIPSSDVLYYHDGKTQELAQRLAKTNAEEKSKKREE